LPNNLLGCKTSYKYDQGHNTGIIKHADYFDLFLDFVHQNSKQGTGIYFLFWPPVNFKKKKEKVKKKFIHK